tara:strand:+ start:231324 stop:232307 length:984 start_codon:yes stop_codon:yes gene_type:complete
MKILIVQNSVIPVLHYGGTERVIWGLGKELDALGHEVTYLVNPGSHSPFANVIELHPEKNLNQLIPEDIDFVHFNFTPQEEIKKPYLVTMHGNPSEQEVLDINTVFISANQASRYNSNTYVYNGLDWSDYHLPILDEKRTYLHFLGKASWRVKNVFGAAKIAIDSSYPLYILGGTKWNYRMLKRGFKYLFNPDIRFMGMVDNHTKMKLMKNSKGLIFPVTWHEPFGLAIIESLYAGCAVFGTKNGSLEELVNTEVGYLSNSSKEITEAIKNFDFNPLRCHKYAVENFNSRRMAKAYVRLYEKILEGKSLNLSPPYYMKDKNKIPEFI